MINIANATIEVEKRRILHQLHTQIFPGRVTAIIGPNGAGKTSLVRAIVGLLKPKTGIIEVENKFVGQLGTTERARLFGYLPQESEPAWDLVVRDLIELGRLPHRTKPFLSSPLDEKIVNTAMIATDTLQFAHRTIKSLSGGEKARVKIARVLAGEPKWIVADEPMANLDPFHQHKMLNLFRNAATAGVGVVIVLHQLDAAAIADDVIILDQGKVIGSGPVHEVLTQANLYQAFRIRFDLVQHQGRLRILSTP